MFLIVKVIIKFSYFYAKVFFLTDIKVGTWESQLRAKFISLRNKKQKSCLHIRVVETWKKD